MRRDFAVFDGQQLMSYHWTEMEASNARRPGQHIRKWARGSWVEI